MTMNVNMNAHRIRALIVDDDRTMRFALVELMRKLGYDVTEAASPGAAHEILKYRSFDMLVSDYQMPGMDGLTLSAIAKLLQPCLRIVLVTACHRDTLPQEARIVDCIVRKPFTVEILDLALKQALSLYSENACKEQSAAA